MKKAYAFTIGMIFCVSLSASAGESNIRRIAIEHEPTMKEISLKVVRLTDAQWTDDLITRDLIKANAVFAQCGVQIKEIFLIEVNFNAIFSNIDDIELLSNKLVDIGFRDGQEVTLIFGGSLDGPLYRMGGQAGGFSFNQDTFQYGDPRGKMLVNLSFVLDVSHSDYYLAIRDGGYSTVAHELVHVFLNYGHVDYPNLMGSARSLVNSKLTPDQCASLKDSPLLQQEESPIRSSLQ